VPLYVVELLHNKNERALITAVFYISAG